ncbi:SMP-30/gluconolactonase/LRE family protein [Paracoccus sp. (in: a-proteobacteria)]|uniref:SMP-30/gluconolactonase/LRE family protein n=1 Tax=Paracoccus sp. TaxID=267 RepID=UPI003A8AC8D8
MQFCPLPGAAIAQVAESPIWDGDGGDLYWVDIIGKRIFRYRLATDEAWHWDCDDFPTAIALCEGGGHDAVLALAGGVSFFDFATGAFTPFVQPDGMPGNRLNEGRCDPCGRFWAGSMQTNLNPDGTGRDMDRNSGALFRIDGSGTVSRHSPHEFGISNTMAWSPDRKTFYFGDSIRDVIFAHDYDDETGTLSNRRVLIEGYGRGAPDGSAIDQDGCLWNARFGGGCVIRITPDGRVDRVIEMPATNITSCTFAGPSRDLLVVTSATFTLSPAQLAANPLEGAVFIAEAGIGGLPDHRFRLPE